MEDWGESEGAGLAALKASHDHQRSERRFQVQVVVIFSILILALVIIQLLDPTIVAKDVVLVALPVFTFVLGKLTQRDG